MNDLKEFEKYVVEHGAIVQPPTNQWELLRFRTKTSVGIVYTNKNGQRTFTGESAAAYDAFKNHKPWRAIDVKRHNLREKKVKLAARDGKMCFFCQAVLGFDELTIEHLLNKSQGGTDHDSNLCLACELCNRTLGNWPLTKKILWRDQKINKTEGEIVRTTLMTVWQMFNERFKSLSMRNLLSRNAPKIELRQIIETMIGEKL